MKSQLPARIGPFLLIVCLLLTGSQVVLAQSGGVRSVDFGGVSFNYDASLAGGVEAKLVPETIEGGNTPFWMAMPQHIEFTFTGLRGSSDRTMQPTIYVFPVLSDYTYLVPDVSHDVWLPSITQLQNLISNQPDLMQHISSLPPDQAWLPYLPPINAVTNPTGKLGYLSFGNGLGVRYLAQRSQDASPPLPDNTFYTFQGLTTDGNFYVAAFFSAFPTSMPPIDSPQGTDIRSYYLDLISRFDAISNDAYTPNLDLLDKMVGSLRVEPANLGVLPGMPRTGGENDLSIVAALLLVGAYALAVGGLLLLANRSKRA
jgi:hypothetical protein